MKLLAVTVVLSVILLTCQAQEILDTPLNCTLSGIELSETEIDAPVEKWLWSTKNSSRVYVLTKSKTVYESINGGKLWRNLNEKMYNVTDTTNTPYHEMGVIDMLFVADETKMYFIGWGDIFWLYDINEDSFHYFQAPEDVVRIYPHPKYVDWALLTTQDKNCTSEKGNKAECYFTLYVTKAAFKDDFVLVQRGIFTTGWGGDDVIMFVSGTNLSEIATALYPSYLKTLYRSPDVGSSFNVALKNCSFVLTAPSLGTIFAIRHEKDAYGSVSLYISSTGGETFTKMNFGGAESEYSYSIVDADPGSIFVNIQREAYTPAFGDLYTSSEFNADFTLTLPLNKRGYLDKSNGYVDFQQIYGFEGMYIANHYLEQATRDSDNKENYLRSKITWDMGGEWTTLTPPDDAQSKNICGTDTDCSLHLLGKAEDPVNFVYSSTQAISLIIGNGNVGKYVSQRADDVNTFLSRDAGKTWSMIREGPHTFQFGDRGALILIASSEKMVNHILWTENEGIKWNKCIFTNDVIDVQDIVGEPSSISRQFLVQSTIMRDNLNNGTQISRGLLVHMEFTGGRPCLYWNDTSNPKSDYEDWTMGCIMGEKETVTRRKQNALCYNAQEYDEIRVNQKCGCTREDYECDGGCWRNDDNVCVNICKGAPNDPEAIPATCTSKYLKSQGYRKVPKTKCEGGVNLLPQWVDCNGVPLAIPTPNPQPTTPSSRNGHGSYVGFIFFIFFVFVLFFVGIFLVVLLLFRFNENFRDTLKPYIPAGLIAEGTFLHGLLIPSNEPNASSPNDGYGNLIETGDNSLLDDDAFLHDDEKHSEEETQT